MIQPITSQLWTLRPDFVKQDLRRNLGNKNLHEAWRSGRRYFAKVPWRYKKGLNAYQVPSVIASLLGSENVNAASRFCESALESMDRNGDTSKILIGKGNNRVKPNV